MKRNIFTEKQRVVTVLMEGRRVKEVVGCDCPTVINCGHICKHIFSACCLLSSQFSARISFNNLKHLMNERFLLKTAIELLSIGCESSENISTTTNGGTEFDVDSDTGDCGAESGEHFAKQLTQPSQTKKGGGLSNVSFDRFRAESAPLFQVGTRNKVIGNAILEALKLMHKTVLGLGPDEQSQLTVSSLLASCAKASLGGCEESTVPSTSNSNLAIVPTDHRGNRPPSVLVFHWLWVVLH